MIDMIIAQICSQRFNATELAQRLLGHPRVTRVHYPGLPDHPGYEISRGQSRGPGAVLSFETDGTGEDAETVYLVYVVGDRGRLEGVVSLRDLLLSPSISRAVGIRADVAAPPARRP